MVFRHQKFVKRAVSLLHMGVSLSQRVLVNAMLTLICLAVKDLEIVAVSTLLVRGEDKAVMHIPQYAQTYAIGGGVFLVLKPQHQEDPTPNMNASSNHPAFIVG